MTVDLLDMAPQEHINHADWTLWDRQQLADNGRLAALAAYIHGHDDATIFHGLAWNFAVSRATGHDFIAAIAHDAQGDICGYCPMHIVHSPFFGRALVSSAFAVDGGILADNRKMARPLFAQLQNHAERYSCSTVELRGGIMPSGQNWQIKDNVHAGFVRALVPDSGDEQADDDAQLLDIPRKQRAEIRKGLKNNLSVKIGRDEQNRDWHYRIYSESVRNLGTPVFPKALFGAVMDEMGENTDILTVFDEDNQPVSSVLSLYWRDIVMPYWGGGLWQARQNRANEIMYYALMCHARKKGCRHFDFGRSKIDTGAYHYKKNWGFEPEALRYAQYAVSGKEIRDINPLSPKYQAKIALWRKLPLPLANILGPVISKGLG